MYEKVINIVSQIIGVAAENLNEESSPENVSYWDSLKHMNLILSLEEEFQVTFSDEEIMEMKNVKSIIETLKSHSAHETN